LTNNKKCATIEQLVAKYCAKTEQILVDKQQIIEALRQIAGGKRKLEQLLKS
jgi:hypothetical protein